MKLLGALALLFLLPAFPGQAQKKTMTYPQLIATRYAPGSPLPTSAQRPAPNYEFVDRTKLPAGTKLLSAGRAASGTIWAVTDKGVYQSKDGSHYAPLLFPDTYRAYQPAIDPDSRVRWVTNDKRGHLWAATSRGIFVSDGGSWWQTLNRYDGVPYDNVNTLHLADNGDVWGGTPEGAWRLRNGKFRYFWGKRWLPGNKVSAIWTDAAGKVWLDTDGGISCIEEKPMTLAEKAAHYDKITQERHNRNGFICQVRLKVDGDPSQGVIPNADDNDGLWTSYYVAAVSLRYAVTKDPAAKKEAQQSINAMLEQERLTGIPGFPARSIATDAEIKAGITGYSPDEIVNVPGEDFKVWFRSPVDKNYWCKGDTSSDEINGHFLAWYLYSEFVADAEEKKKIAATCRRTIDHIIANQYTLVGHTGHPTRWGNWGPQLLNDNPLHSAERGLNSLEILSYLKVAQHLTGDAKYQKAYDELVALH